MTNLTRPGASSSTVWIAPASTEGWRVNGLVTAGNSVRRDVLTAACPRTTNVSRESIWLSRIPAPSKPAASMNESRRMSSGIGAVPGTRRWTRTGSAIAGHGIPIRHERRHAPMRFGTFYFFQAVPWLSHDEVVHRELEQMEWTEELGFDQIWLTEHHFIDYGLAVDPGTLAAVAASRTRRVRIGLAAAILPFHHPLRLAEQTALVDIVSRGRLEVGFGRGNRPAKFRGYNVPQQENRDRFEEAVEIITQAWTQTEPFSYEGRFFTVRDTRVMPKPFQKPHPPLYQVCGSKESIEGTAARGWPMLNSVLRGNAEQQLATNREAYVAAARKAGQSEDDITGLLKKWGVSRQIYVAPTDAQAQAESKDAEMWYQESFRRFVIPERIEEAHPSLQPHFRQLAERLARINWDDLVRETVAFGSPDTVARKIEAMRDAGVGHVLCWMNFGGLPQDKIRRSMELFAREVMPHFRDR